MKKWYDTEDEALSAARAYNDSRSAESKKYIPYVKYIPYKEKWYLGFEVIRPLTKEDFQCKGTPGITVW
ncbi:MAG: hypothetical protein NC226_09680 [Bacteroides cellulosilyticus]|nr:hypothetical protein [Bacteroides cellulosilyticus]